MKTAFRALLVFVPTLLFAQENLSVLPEGVGLSAKYPGDTGISRHPAVVFVEDFETGTLADFGGRWSDIKNKDGKVMALSEDVPPYSPGHRSLRVTATRGLNDGGHLFRTFQSGYDRLFLRFYVKFAPDAGFNHHFVSLGGEIDPKPYAIGRAGLRPKDRWNTGIEPTPYSQYAGRTVLHPPGIWHFYTYWPEMRSWQSEDGHAVNDNGKAFYGNNFEPAKPVPVRRGEWTCVEIMVKLNSSPDSYDGEQAVWIDGKLAGRFAKGTMRGKWVRDMFRVDPAGEPFEGFRWRTDMRVKINKLWLSHYVSNESAFPRTEKYAAAHPEVTVDTQRQTVWFDHIVVATDYIGPLARPVEDPGPRTH
jgi:hypothetical protein